jgi:hypothetical protein
VDDRLPVGPVVKHEDPTYSVRRIFGRCAAVRRRVERCGSAAPGQSEAPPLACERGQWRRAHIPPVVS